MRMKIVQLEAQSERSLSAKEVLARHANVTLLQTASVRDFQRAADSQDVDLFLCSQSDLTSDGEDLLAILNAKYPHVPVVILSTADERAELLRDPDLRAWDVLSASELDRLALCITRAVESKRLRDGLQSELTQARDLLISCQKSISVGRLLGSIAHEINNPLEAISNLLYLGQRNASDEEEARKCLQMAEAELQRVGEITKQMLYFHRDSKSPQEVALSEVIESVFVLYQNRLDMRHIEVLKQYRSNAMLMAHPGELRQAFSNFIANAIDAMPHGGQLLVRVREGGRCKLSVTIADRGHGISREGIRRLGELLFTTKGEAGTGLGLWVSYRIIAKYGGSIQVYSSTRSERNGTVFKICFADTNTIAPGRNQSTAAEMTSTPQRFEDDRSEGGEVDLDGWKLTA